ncbi:tellurite resistance TerB family protein [Rhizobium sp. KVB221]|uniref:Tellurite resistance TerB family protein n=1 Tax=Rhizobium setariae TaxID=2801340 RepID=A0A936YJS1_9HYPH|nr:tellurite resistance TerB family protein [Rhizobium setariae]MBL0371575.1 tellurite resistance TerB family protein [Rhizobium setariae]
MANTVTIPAALIYVMVMVSAADGHMPDAELQRIGRLAKFLPVFQGFDEEKIIPATREVQAILAGSEGLEIALETIKDALPPRLYDTAYALAVEVATADLWLDQTEVRFLQLLRARLEIDKLTAAAIERSAIARFRRV